MSCFFNFCILSLLLLNGQQELYVNPGCLTCNSGINLSPVIKNVFTISFILYLVLTSLILKTKADLLKEFYLKVSLFLSYLIIH